MDRLSLNLLDVIILLYHLRLGAEEEEVGFVDADKTMTELTMALTKRWATIPTKVVESAMWSANMCNEQEMFWSPRKNESFDSWVKRIERVTRRKFDKYYNHFEEEKNGK